MKVTDEEKIVYHVGDFSRKAETLEQLNCGRGTGYFGTGYYFTTKWENCADQGGGHRPLYQINIKDYEFYYGDLERHNALKKLNRFISSYPLLSIDMDFWRDVLYCYEKMNPTTSYSYSDSMSLGEYLKQDWEGYNKDHYDSWQEYVSYSYEIKRMIELCKQTDELQKLGKELSSKNPSWKVIDSFNDSIYFNREEYNRIKDMKFDNEMLPIELGVKSNEFNSVCKEIYDELKSYYDEDGYLNRNRVPRNYDSIPTLFIKKLGYDGVYPSKECDNITYGGCIFELDKAKDVTLLATDVSKFNGELKEENMGSVKKYLTDVLETARNLESDEEQISYLLKNLENFGMTEDEIIQTFAEYNEEMFTNVDEESKRLKGIKKSMQCGGAMATMLPTNSVYQGNVVDLY